MNAHNKLLLALGVASAFSLSSCGKNSGSTNNNGVACNPQQVGSSCYNPNVYTQGGYGVSGAYSIPGPPIPNCLPQMIKLRGQCTQFTDFAQACANNNGTFIPNASVPNAQNQQMGVCAMKRTILPMQFVTKQWTFGTSGASIPFSASLRQMESMVVYGNVKKNRPGLEWQLELIQNGMNVLGSASGGSGQNSTGNGCGGPSLPQNTGNCNNGRGGSNGEFFKIFGSPLYAQNGIYSNGANPYNNQYNNQYNNPYGQNGQYNTSNIGIPMQFELRLLTRNTFRLDLGVSAISCEDGRNNYVSCPPSALSTTL